ncbi:MAG: aminoglycoside phosphotransferase family protein [Spirochaetales bacterium]|nr:aminoglycoside phosphotransferase family protein [Spirochaetales bacterium]
MFESIFYEIARIAREFDLSNLINVSEIHAGKVNHTCRADFLIDGWMHSYIVQKVNTYVFRKPWDVMHNIGLISEYMAENHPEIKSLCYIHTLDGKNYFEDGPNFWRMYKYVDSVTYNSSRDPVIVHNAGRAFGRFQKALDGFDSSLLRYTIPNFHNTTKRFRDLESDFESDPLRRASSCASEVSYVLSMKDKALVLDRLYSAGRIPLRVTHNDTKINNVLFDPDTKKAVCVVDLDTVMPGLAGHDFGDAIRSAGNSMGSSSLEFDKVCLNMEVFRGFASGFLSQTASLLVGDEISSLADSCLVMTLELASRYLDDYLIGDKYFNAKYETQNLDRARNLIALAKSMDSKMPEMRSVISSVVSDCVSQGK